MDVSLSGLRNVQVNQPGWTQKQHKNTINSEPPTYHRLINDLLEVERMPPYTFLIMNWDCRNIWAYSNHIRETRPNNLPDILDQGKGVTPPSGLHKLMNSYQGDSMAPHPSVIWYKVGLCQEKRTLNDPEVSVQLWPSFDRLEVCLLFICSLIWTWTWRFCSGPSSAPLLLQKQLLPAAGLSSLSYQYGQGMNSSWTLLQSL